MEHRKLVAIMFTDIVGFTVMSQKNESLAIELLDEHRTILRRIFPQFGGVEIKTIGDAFLVEFASAVNAALCAVAIQKEMSERNASVPEVHRVYLRIGIHVGDILQRADDVLGDGVNVASRIFQIAEPGGISLSQQAADQIRNKIPQPLRPIGKQELKGLERSVDIYEILLDANEAALAGLNGLDKHRIVVLPLANISTDPTDEYFADGMTEEVISRLSKIRDLKVASRGTSFRYKGKRVDAQQVGRDLGAGSVIEGSVRKYGERLRIGIQLTNAEDGFPLWSEEYDRQLEDVFTVQSEIAQKVAEALRVHLVAAVRDQIGKRATQNMEAYTLYLMGRFHWNKRTEEGVTKGIECFQDAIGKDKNYALAYAGLADCYILLGSFQLGAMPSLEAKPRAKAAAIRALEIDDLLAEAHTSLAFTIFSYDWNWAKAEQSFKMAIEFNPNYPTAHHWYAHYLAAMGRFDEAIAEAKQAQFLDPLSRIINTDVGTMLYWSRQHEAALEQCKKALELDPDFLATHFILGLIYEQLGDYEKAILEFEEALRLSEGNLVMRAMLAYTYAVSGKIEEGWKRLAEIKEFSKQRYASSSLLALVYTGLGEKATAFEWLEKSYEQRSHWLAFMKIWPLFDRLRSDARFDPFLKKVGFSAKE
jgi:TolB-like protein/Flp pilus assembly protein TadD